MIKSLDLEFPDYIIGYSDHTLGTDIASYSIFYGSKCIEKHFTYDKNLSVSRDHRLSLNSDDFKELIKKIKLIEMSRGSSVRDNFSAESSAVEFARRSIVSKCDIPKGTEITENMIDVKRPGTGILPKYFFKIIGSKTLKDIPEDSTIQWTDIDFNQ
jgi:sialic acid synthase SpsE